MTDDLELEMDAYLPLRDVVFRTLRAAILKGDLKPGERLMELQLAAKLGVSRTPIREAIRMLEQEGLAITYPRKGAEVARMTEKDVDDVLQIRCALEELAVRLSCQNISETEITQLKISMENFAKETASGGITAIARADENFHDVFYNVADNPKLLGLLSNFREQMYRYRVEYLKDISVYPWLLEEHRQLYEAIKDRDADKAAAITRMHLEHQTQGVKRIIREQEQAEGQG
ncbi:MAG: GntR family transcriptional regulator [Clostridiales bacterium]|nr:GntR family transcriptional regulator [Clostridiales bacterium]